MRDIKANNAAIDIDELRHLVDDAVRLVREQPRPEKHPHKS